MEEVGHSCLDYNDLKQPSLSSRSYRVKNMPENGPSLKSEQVVYLSLPSGLPETYVDFSKDTGRCYYFLIQGSFATTI